MNIWRKHQCSQNEYECLCHWSSAAKWNALLSAINFSLCSFASSSPISKAPSLSKWLCTIVVNSGGSLVSPALLDPVATPLVWSISVSSTGIFDIVSVWMASAHHESCWGGTFAVEITRTWGSTSQRAMKRLWPGLDGSVRWKGDTRCWLRNYQLQYTVDWTRIGLTRHLGKPAIALPWFQHFHSFAGTVHRYLLGMLRKLALARSIAVDQLPSHHLGRLMFAYGRIDWRKWCSRCRDSREPLRRYVRSFVLRPKIIMSDLVPLKMWKRTRNITMT